MDIVGIREMVIVEGRLVWCWFIWVFVVIFVMCLIILEDRLEWWRFFGVCVVIFFGGMGFVIVGMVSID